MDIFRIQSLIYERKLLKPGDVKAEDIFLQAGVYKPHNRKLGASNANAYPSFVVQGSQLKELLDITSGCPIEYTKINTHSFVFQPSLDDTLGDLVIGGRAEKDLEGALPVWSNSLYDYYTKYTAGAIENITSSQATIGVPTPINLTPLDVITMTGTAYFNNYSAYQNTNYDLFFVLGVYYFNCSEVNDFSGATAFTFVPLLTEKFDTSGKVCFAAEAVLGSNFDYHDTRLIVGAQIYKVCKLAPGDCLSPRLPQPNRCSVSYTIDIASPCEKIIPEKKNYLIKNCCTPEIPLELINSNPLTVGGFYVDTNSNCWEVIEESTDVTNYTRTLTTLYQNCAECQAANPCPRNLLIQCCCVLGVEFVSGALQNPITGADLVQGDIFVDTGYGLCWEVLGEIGAPVSEESIQVQEVVGPDCETCITAHPCPNFYYVQSCCTENIGGIIASDVTPPLVPGEVFVDNATGICWQVKNNEVLSLPTIYGVNVDTRYSSLDACTACIAANPCPENYFITIRQCCDTNRTEVVQVPAEYMTFNEGKVFQDYWGVCWEVMSFSTTGTPTGYEIWGWTTNPKKPSFSFYESCNECIGKERSCRYPLRIKDCKTNIEYNAIIYTSIFAGNATPTIGDIFNGTITTSSTKFESCFEVIGYYDPVYPDSFPTSFASVEAYFEYATCQQCLDTKPK